MSRRRESAEQISVLVLADDQKANPNTIHDHIRSFQRYSRHNITVVNPRNLTKSRVLKLENFDAVVIHYSIVIIWDDYLSPWFRDRLVAYDGLKVQFIQDEYRWVDEITAESRRLGIDVLYSVVPPGKIDSVYGDRLPGVEVLPTLTGFVPEEAVGRSAPPPGQRTIDVGYRGRTLPYWLGRLGHEKIEIGRGFLARQDAHRLRCDIAWSESARIYGDRWYEWIGSCRSMLASESGSSIVDYDRSAERAVRAFVARHPLASFDEVESAVLAPFGDGPVINTISPRIFESAAMRTALIMFPGEYSGLVRPWEHYVPLERDFSNVAEVAERIHDLPFLAELTARVYRDLIGSSRYTYQTFVAGVDDDIAARVGTRRRGGRFPSVILRAEQISTGRTYRLSALYDLAREGLLGYVGVRGGIGQASLRRLGLLALRRRPAVAGAPSLRDDLFRLAVLTGVRQGSVGLAGDPFDLHPAIEDDKLTFTSRPRGEPRTGIEPETVRAGLSDGTLREILWNHAGVGQYVTLRLPLTTKNIAFDVGRYDTYGVYRFSELVGVAREDPDLVLAALEPLLRSEP